MNPLNESLRNSQISIRDYFIYDFFSKCTNWKDKEKLIKGYEAFCYGCDNEKIDFLKDESNSTSFKIEMSLKEEGNEIDRKFYFLDNDYENEEGFTVELYYIEPANSYTSGEQVILFSLEIILDPEGNSHKYSLEQNLVSMKSIKNENLNLPELYAVLDDLLSYIQNFNEV